VVIVDDWSDEPLQLDRENVKVIRPDEKGFFSGAVNEGVNSVQTDVLVLNQDVWFEGVEWLGLVNAHRDHGTMGHGVFGHPAWNRGYVQGTFMYIKRDAWDDAGEFNAFDYPLWGSTNEWQLRACRKGYKALPLREIPGMKHRERGKHRFGSAVGEALMRWPGQRREFLRTPPMLSVIVPCYNYGKYLPDAVNSLLGGPTSLGEWEPQTFQSFEIVIVDDASTDEETKEVVRQLHDPWKGVRSLLLSQNMGTPGALNVGIEHAYGEFVHILSADDMRESWALEKQVRAAIDNPGMVIYGDIESFKGSERLKAVRLLEYDFDDMLYKNPMPAGITYPREAWVKAGGYPARMIYGREDWAFNIALGIHGFCGHKLPGMSGNLYRREGQNRSLRTANVHRHERYTGDPRTAKGWSRRFLTQLMSLYPQLYEGERPVGCCGGRNRKPRRQIPVARTARAMEPLPGRDGFVLLEYVGGNSGSASYFGPATGHKYTFGGNDKDRIGYVDREDAPDMLDLMRHRRPVFSVYVTPEPEPDLGMSEKEEQFVNPPDPKEATPAAAKLAAEIGMDLSRIEGTGKDGKIVKSDIEALLV
jgi:glycosyltransferase involved in cell wall biosynthesis